MRKLPALVICACIAVSAVFAQTRQQALDRRRRDARYYFLQVFTNIEGLKLYVENRS